MELDALTAVSPIDGRYHGKTKSLADYFSEYALIKYRVRVEIEYFITLCELPLPQLKGFDPSLFESLRNIYRHFSEADALRVKDIEKVTNHDVKAVEYFIKEELDKIGNFDQYKEFIHFGLTSQDINNTSVPLSIKEALSEVYYPLLGELIAQLQEYAETWKDVSMLAKTHGQPASPTRLGKEIEVYVYRLKEQLDQLKACRITAKFGGATGNYNAHHVAYPAYDWKQFGNRFVSEKLGLERTMDHPDFQLRQSECHLRCHEANQHYHHRLESRLLDVCLHGILQAENQGRRSRFLSHAAQGESHRL